jgi:RHS repeat-associated protein
VPEPPVQFDPPLEPTTVKPGEGFTGIGLPENDIFYFHPDHLGSTSYITARNGSISQHVEYIAFGEVLFEEHSSSFSSPYLFNGKELDRETNLSYYGARYLDMKTSLWLNVDPLAEKYQFASSYSYCLNNPLNAVDPDGKRVIFVNGHWSRILGFFGMAPSGSKESYWNFFSSKIITAARNFFGSKADESDVFVDGSSKFGGDMSGPDRVNAGYQYAKDNLETLTKGLKKDETIKFVSHSEGGAYSAGMAKFLIEKGYNVEFMLNLSPDEADEFSNPIEPTVIQLHSKEDIVSPGYRAKKTDYYTLLPADGLTTNHGQTVTGAAIDKLGKLYKMAKEKEKTDFAAGLKQSNYTIYENGVSITKDVKANR